MEFTKHIFRVLPKECFVYGIYILCFYYMRFSYNAIVRKIDYSKNNTVKYHVDNTLI